jgi:DNA-binding PadR family transcriptional regulator
MEENGLVTSKWDQDSSLGPQRRIYTITSEGEDYLNVWVADLRRTRQEINALISAFEQVGK